MKRGKLWEDKIVVTRDEVSKRPKVTCEGMWSGKDRRMINRMMLKAMRVSSNESKKIYKKAVLAEENSKADSIKMKKVEALKLARAAKKAKKVLKEEELNNDRGKDKSK